MNRLIQKLKNAPKDVIKAATHKKEKKDKNDGDSDEVLELTAKERKTQLVFPKNMCQVLKRHS